MKIQANPDDPRERGKAYQRDWHKAAYAKNPEKFKERSRNRRSAHAVDINARRREVVAQRREIERSERWAKYIANPPNPSLPPGYQLRLWLEAKSWNVRRLAIEIGVSARSIFDWINGKHPPVRHHLGKVHEITGLECFTPPLALDVRERRPKYVEEVQSGTAILKDLVIRCGLASREIRGLEVSHLEVKGIRTGKGRLIPFGDGWHEVSLDSFKKWMSVAQPQKYLFFQHKPVDRGRPATRLWIVRMLNKAGVSIRRSQTPRVQHFAGDAKRFGAGPRLLKHFRAFHGLSKTHSIAVWKQLIREGGSRSLVGARPLKNAGRKPQKTEIFKQAEVLHQNPGGSWPKIAKQLDPKAWAENPRKAAESIRQGVLRMKRLRKHA